MVSALGLTIKKLLYPKAAALFCYLIKIVAGVWLKIPIF
jgi:hypothetical protein